VLGEKGLNTCNPINTAKIIAYTQYILNLGPLRGGSPSLLGRLLSFGNLGLLSSLNGSCAIAFVKIELC
jgi:hypothetical protein